MTRVRSLLVALRYGFLFVPGVVATGVSLSALAIVRLDRLGGSHGLGIGFSADAVAARTLLSTIASSLVTVAGVSYSITIVALQLVSQQFSPRALRNFLADVINQIVIGYFAGVFVYCLLVLRAVRNTSSGGGFVPSLSILVALLLAIGGLALLLVFINHMAGSIQLSAIAARASRAAVQHVDRLYPDPFAEEGEADTAAELRRWRADGQAHVVRAGEAGFIRSIDVGAVAALDGLRVNLLVAPGAFVTTAMPTAEVWPADRGEEAAGRVGAAITVGDARDVDDDIGYALRQLADIALKALSPGVNDPTTAVTCIFHMREIVEQLAARAFPSPLRRDRSVVVAPRPTFAELLDHLDEVARAGRDFPRVLEAVDQALAGAAHVARDAGAHERAALLEARRGR